MTLALSAPRAVALLAIGAAIVGRIAPALEFGQRGARDAPAESASARAR